jgi:stalled ribosome alternative rescue factor ArfA
MLEGSAAGTDEIVRLAEGRPGLALRLSEDGELRKKMEDDRKAVLSLFGKGSYARMESVSRIYEMEKEEVAEVLDGWIIALRAEMLESLAQSGREKEEKFRNMKAALEKTIASREDILERNVNLRLALENLVLGFK